MPQKNSHTELPLPLRRTLSRYIKLPLILGVMGVLVFVCLVFYLRSVMQEGERIEQVTRNVVEARRNHTEMQAALHGYLLTDDASFLRPYENAAQAAQKRLTELPQQVANTPSQLRQANALLEQHQRWAQYTREVLDTHAQGPSPALTEKISRSKQMSEEVLDMFAVFVGAEHAMHDQQNRQANHLTLLIVFGYALFSLISHSLLSWLGRRQLRDVALNYEQTLNEQQKQAATLEEQAWLRGAQSELTHRALGQLSTRDFASQLLQFFATHLSSVVGTVYLREELGSLQRIAAYGLSGETETPVLHIRPGEGLVGQAAQQDQLLQLSPVPAGYMRVQSGLGAGQAHTLLIVPLLHEGKVNGVVELGLLTPPQPRELKLVEACALSAGDSLAAARYRERLQSIVTETQQLNEELQVQQEELRTANEELEEQSRALKESQVNLEQEQVALANSNAQLAERTAQLDMRNVALRRAHLDLEERAQALARASRYKSEFLANISHELRTPLNSTLILSKLLLENKSGNLNPEQLKFADNIYSAGNDLLNLINDVLDIAKIEAGQFDLELRPVLLTHLIESLESTFQPQANAKSLSLRIEMTPEAPPLFTTDQRRLEQILKNLVANAIKFTEEGHVTVKVSRSGGGPRFDIVDSGIGIPESEQALIFAPFHQADSAINRKYGGTGLGLSISRDLAWRLGGYLSVKSSVGLGSTFTLLLPADAANPLPESLRGRAFSALHEDPTSFTEAPEYSSNEAGIEAENTTDSPQPPPPSSRALTPLPPTPSTAAFQNAPFAPALSSAAAVVSPEPDLIPAEAPLQDAPGTLAFTDDRLPISEERRRVLVIQDEPQFARILYDLAHEYGWHCAVAHGPQEGLVMAQHLQPQAIVLDMRLADSQGLTVLQQLKDTAQTRHIPVHVVSAQEQADVALHLGAVGYALVPTSREELQTVFTQLEAKVQRTTKHVLLVEDEEIQRQSITSLIASDDVHITTVATGLEALEKLETQIFDCMIVDLNLPDISGSELLKRMAKAQSNTYPPVIIYTGRNLTRDEEVELLHYSRSIIVKGARSPERLLDEVTLFLHEVESQLSREQQGMLRTARARDYVFDGRHILLVDDDMRNLFALTSALEQRGATVTAVSSGREALNKLYALPDISLVLMDVMMPDMDGLEAMRRIRRDPRWAKLPIIAVTAKVRKVDQEDCLAAGANDFLPKPIELNRLFALLRVWMPPMERL